MLNTEQFKVKKHELRESLAILNPEGAKQELEMYNFILQVCENYNKRMSVSIEDLFRPLDEAIFERRAYEEISAIESSIKDELPYWKMAHRHDPAFIIAKNFNSDPNYNYEKHFSKEEKLENVVGKHYLDSLVKLHLELISYEDGAIILDSKDNVLATHVHLINLNPDAIVKKQYAEGGVYPGYGQKNPRFFGFRQNVNTRHLSALYASFLPGVITYTLGERIEKFEIVNFERKLKSVDDGHIRRYQDGLITFSTFDKERDAVMRSIEIIRRMAA